MSKLDRLRNAITPGASRDHVRISGGPDPAPPGGVDPEAPTAPSAPVAGMPAPGPGSPGTGAVPPAGPGPFPSGPDAGTSAAGPGTGPSSGGPGTGSVSPGPGTGVIPAGPGAASGPAESGFGTAAPEPGRDSGQVADGPAHAPEGARFHDAPVTGTGADTGTATPPDHSPGGARFHDAPHTGTMPDHSPGGARDSAPGSDRPDHADDSARLPGTDTKPSGEPRSHDATPPVDSDHRPGMGAVSPMDTNATTRLTRVPADGAPGTGRPDEPAVPFLEPDQIDRLNARWKELQGEFVDNPHDAVTRADLLLAETVEQLTARWTERQQQLQGRWSRGTDSDTENLRQALRDYRTFFQKLLTLAG